MGQYLVATNSVTLANATMNATPPQLDKYALLAKIGSGHTATVHKAKVLATGEIVAIKVIKKPKKECKLKEMLEVEKDILSRIQHPNLVSVHEIFESAESLYIVMELVEGGDLFDMVVKHEHFTEKDARHFTTDLLNALHYLHTSAHVCHRDLKPENILLTRSDINSSVKIADFGMSKVYQDTDDDPVALMVTRCGTPGYVAPEVVSKKRYSEAVDMWSLGVVLYIMLCGRPPFYGDNDVQVMQRIKLGKFSMTGKHWSHVSSTGKQFVKSLLQVDPTKRPTAAEALSHAWFTPHDSVATVAAAPPNGRLLNSEQRELLDKCCATTPQTCGGAKVAPTPLTPEPSALLSSYMCSLDKRPGKAIITTNSIKFVDESGGVMQKIQIKDVLDLQNNKIPKACRFGLPFMTMPSSNDKTLSIVTRNKRVHEFGGLRQKNDEALKMSILCSMQLNAFSEGRELGITATN